MKKPRRPRGFFLELNHPVRLCAGKIIVGDDKGDPAGAVDTVRLR